MFSALLIAITSVSVGQTSNLTYVATYTNGLQYPGRLAPAPGGGVYVTDEVDGAIAQFDGTGAMVNMYTIPELPIGIAVGSAGRVFVSRCDGKVGIYDSAFAPQGLLNPAPFTLQEPSGLAVHSGTGEVYVADSAAGRILVFDGTTGALVRMWGVGGSGLSQFVSPQTIAVDPVLNRVLVADTDNFRVQVFDTQGTFQFKFGYRILFLPNSETAWFARSEGLAVDACGNIYISDALMGTVRVFSETGVELNSNHTPAIRYGSGTGQLRVPCDLLIEGGRLYVANTDRDSVEVFGVTCTEAPFAPPGDTPSPDRIVDGSKPSKGALASAAFTSVAADANPQNETYPDNPFDIVAAIRNRTNPRALDVNHDGRVNLSDLTLVVHRFGGATVKDFLSPPGSPENSTDSYVPPHVIDLPYSCGRCHAMDGAPGGMTSAVGQENLCLSCHSSGKIAGKEWVGGSHLENSHPWGVQADAGSSDGPASSSELALHLDAGKIRCGTCHNPHESPFDLPDDPSTTADDPITTPFYRETYLRGTILDAGLCAECHPQVAEWRHAGHSDEHADPFSHYNWTEANRAACRKCHSGYGYIDFAAGVPQASQRGNFRVLDCMVCHTTHGALQDESLLRIYDDVTLPSDPIDFPNGFTLTDAGPSATCYTCHNGRAAPPVQNTNATPVSTPHYALGGVMLEGINGVDFGNTSLTNSAHTLQVACVDCHMAPGPTSGHGAGKVGGHTFALKVHDPDDPDFGFENVVSACQGCHAGLTTLNRTAGGDYDGDTTIEGVQDEVRGLMALLLGELQARGAIQLPGYPYWNIAGVAVAERITVKNAIWNWEYVDNSGDYGVKNTAYAVGLLQLTLEKLTGEVLVADLRYTP